MGEGRKGGREGRGWGVEVVSNNESPNTTRRRSLLVFLLVYRSNKQTNKQTDSLLKTSVTINHCKALFIWRKVTTGPPPPRANFTTRVHGKNVSRVMMSCPSPRTEISARACSEWRDLARQGELTRLKPFTWSRKLKFLSPQGHPVSPTQWPYPQGHPIPPSQVCSFSCKRSTTIYKQL